MLRFLRFCERRLMYLCVSSRRPTASRRAKNSSVPSRHGRGDVDAQDVIVDLVDSEPLARAARRPRTRADHAVLLAGGVRTEVPPSLNPVAQLSTMAASDSRPRTPNPAHAAPPH